MDIISSPYVNPYMAVGVPFLVELIESSPEKPPGVPLDAAMTLDGATDQDFPVFGGQAWKR